MKSEIYHIQDWRDFLLKHKAPVLNQIVLLLVNLKTSLLYLPCQLEVSLDLKVLTIREPVKLKKSMKFSNFVF